MLHQVWRNIGLRASQSFWWGIQWIQSAFWQQDLVKKHSEFIGFPIKLYTEKTTEKEVTDDDDDDEDEGDEDKPKVEEVDDEEEAKKEKKTKKKHKAGSKIKKNSKLTAVTEEDISESRHSNTSWNQNSSKIVESVNEMCSAILSSNSASFQYQLMANISVRQKQAQNLHLTWNIPKDTLETLSSTFFAVG